MPQQTTALLDRLFKLGLKITTVESCTAGLISSLLSEHPKAGSLLESGVITYTIEAKIDLLDLSPTLFQEYNLTSEKVAEEMALGAAKHSRANTIIAITGVLDDTAEPEIPAGTVCFCWLFKVDNDHKLFTQTHRFSGTSRSRCKQAAIFALVQTAELYKTLST